MPSVKFGSKNKYKGKSTRKRKAHNASMREQMKRKTDNVESFIGDIETAVLGDENRTPHFSASASKLSRFRNGGDGQNAQDHNAAGQHSWVFVECGQLSDLLADVSCPSCEEGSLVITTSASMGFAQELSISCTTCEYSRKTFSSARVNKQNDRQNVAFEANKQMVLYTHEIGIGYTSLQKLCAVFGMPVMNKKTYHRLDNKINACIRRTCQLTLDESVEKVKNVYHQMFPLGIPPMNPALPQVEEKDDEEEEQDDTEWDEDDGTPWMDVSFDGTWMKRGFTSHYGIGTVIDIFTGYVVDFELLCTYCHICEMSKEKLEGMTADQQQAWQQQHEPQCQINHEGSAKAMEKEAAIKIWAR